MKAALITVGDELLIGQVVNTNAAWIGEQCAARGVSLVRSATVGDSETAIHSELASSVDVADVVFITGGLGPTHDDITRESVAAWFGRALVPDESLVASIRDRFESRGVSMPESNVRQAMVPDGFEVIRNPHGSAPGLTFSWQENGQAKAIFLTPGVPFEMRAMFDNGIWPRLAGSLMEGSILSRTIRTSGIGESTLARRLAPVHELLDDNVTLAYLPSLNQVRLRIMAHTLSDDGARERLESIEVMIHELAGRYIFGYGDTSLEEAVVARCRDAGVTIATAESCTGGLIQTQT